MFFNPIFKSIGRFIILFLFIAFLFAACATQEPVPTDSETGTLHIKTVYPPDGRKRSYRLHIPRNYAADKKYPLVVVIHGAFSNAKKMEKETGFSELADREDFIVLYPDGIGLFGLLQTWNAGHCCGKAAKDDVDDTGFIQHTISEVRNRYSVDRKRIYMAGMSNGGMMAYRYAAEKSREIAALAVVAGCIGSEKQDGEKKWVLPRPDDPVPLFIVHGEDDFVVPFDGGFGRREGPGRTFKSVADACEFWREANGCGRFSRQRFFLDNRIIKMWWEGNRGDQVVMLYRVRRWGHVWPGRVNTESLNENDTLRGFDIAPIIWNFFRDRKKQ